MLYASLCHRTACHSFMLELLAATLTRNKLFLFLPFLVKHMYWTFHSLYPRNLSFHVGGHIVIKWTVRISISLIFLWRIRDLWSTKVDMCVHHHHHNNNNNNKGRRRRSTTDYSNNFLWLWFILEPHRGLTYTAWVTLLYYSPFFLGCFQQQ